MDLPKPRTRIITGTVPPANPQNPPPGTQPQPPLASVRASIPTPPPEATRPVTPPPPSHTPVPDSPSAPSAPSPSTSRTPSLRRRRKYRLRRRSYHAHPLIETTEITTTDGAPVEATVAPSAPVPAPAPGIDPAELDAMRTAREAAEKERDEVKELLLRTRADMENQRKRHVKERDDIRKFASEDLLQSLMPALDHFGLALASIDATTDIDSVRQGIRMIHRELMGVLQQSGLEVLNPVGEMFDPNRHDAGAAGSDASQPDGVVLEVFRSGWALRGRVLRPAMVKVNKLESAPAAPRVVTPAPNP